MSKVEDLKEFVEDVIYSLRALEPLYLCPKCGLLNVIIQHVEIYEVVWRKYDVFQDEVLDEDRDPYSTDEEVLSIECPTCGREVEELIPYRGEEENYEEVIGMIVEFVEKNGGEKEREVLRAIMRDEKIKPHLSDELIKKILLTLI